MRPCISASPAGAGECLQPGDLDADPSRISPDSLKIGAQLGAACGIATVDGGNRRKGGEVHAGMPEVLRFRIIPQRTLPRRLHSLSERHFMSANDFRVERDSMGELRVPADALWGAQTQRAVQNFPISGLRHAARLHSRARR